MHDTADNTHMNWLEDTIILTDIVITPTLPIAPINVNLNIGKEKEPT